MKNLFISELNKKDIEHFTTQRGLFLRKKGNRIFRKLCNAFTQANIIKIDTNQELSDEQYFNSLSKDLIDSEKYPLQQGKNNIILERYPKLNEEEPYIFVCNHTCPEDIETVFNIIDRNAYLVLGSIETLKYNPEAYFLWANGVIPFDILQQEERKTVIPKAEKVLKTNSILIFPEGSHNYHPNKIINNLYDGPANLALQTGRKIVIISLLRDQEKNISYIDVSNPIDVQTMNNYPDEKAKVKDITLQIRDKMATAIYHMMTRHFEPVSRKNYDDIEMHYRDTAIQDAFKKLKWKRDVFTSEYLTKKTQEDKAYEEVVNTLANVTLNKKVLKDTQINHREYVLKSMDLERKNIVNAMRDYWERQETPDKKRLIKK